MRLGALGSVLADAVKQETTSQDTSQDSNNKCNCASNCCCHLHSRTSTEGSLYILCKNNTKHLLNHIIQPDMRAPWWTMVNNLGNLYDF